jgi:PTH1 family peptidyl-tRNA hydrolase
MKLIVGLGNPGDKYAFNRHNIGFLTVDEIARTYRFGPWKTRFHGSACEGLIAGEKCILLKPSTYMNESGRAVGDAVRFYKLGVEDVIVIHDELDLEPGKVRIKVGGGNAGHNGLKSISAYIGNEYRRVRLGIGHPGDKALVAQYVLRDFAKADREWLDPLLDAIARGMARLVEGSDASFLNEAARSRITHAKAQMNGHAAPAPKPEMATVSAVASAAQMQASMSAERNPPAPAISAPVSAPAAAAPAPAAPIAAAPVPPQPSPMPTPRTTDLGQRKPAPPLGLGEKFRLWIVSRFRGSDAR